MSRKWYGSIDNRLEENKQFCPVIEIGTGMTEYFYSDRHAYEVIEVKDQKHVTVRELRHIHEGNGSMDNRWTLVSDPDGRERNMVKRGKYWYDEVTITSDLLDSTDIDTMLFLGFNNVDEDELSRKGTIKRYHRANVSFGVADYYYDYEF